MAMDVRKGGLIGRNNAVVAFAQSGRSEFPALYFTGRLATDPLNTMRQSVLLKAGAAPKEFLEDDPTHPGLNRYGDYFGIAVDPVDGSFWVYGEYV